MFMFSQYEALVSPTIQAWEAGRGELPVEEFSCGNFMFGALRFLRD